MAEQIPRRASRIMAVALLALILGVALFLARGYLGRPEAFIAFFEIPRGLVREPLPYRIVSFHRGRADKNLIKLASQLGFNGVQIQIEGSNVGGVQAFADYDRKHRLIDYVHSLKMDVTVWVREFADLPAEDQPGYLGPIDVDNTVLWDHLESRYEWILGTALPRVDGLTLTVVETQENATATPIMLKLVAMVDRKCRQHGKYLIVRTFVWHPDELEGVMGAIEQMPEDIVVMSKVVPQDWQMRAPHAVEIGAVGGRPQIVEYDVAGEYFLKDHVANCMVGLLKTQFDYGLTKGVKGICVRVDRDDSSVLFEPQEVNLWALGMLAYGSTDDEEQIWQRWATYRYGPQAAPGVIRALKPTSDVVAEMLSIGPFTHGDTRRPPAQPDEYIFGHNWQPWRWDRSYIATLTRADTGDALFVDELRRQKAAALKIADQSLIDLELVKDALPEKEYRILRTKLLSNRVQLEYRTATIMAAMHYRQMLTARTDPQWEAARDHLREDIAATRRLADRLAQMPPPRNLRYLGKTWWLDYPLGISVPHIEVWATLAEELLEW